MFKFTDFFHLPQLDPLFEQMIAEKDGLMLLAGIESRGGAGQPMPEGMNAQPVQKPKAPFLPSGLSTLSDVIVQAVFSADPLAQAIFIVSDRTAARIPRLFKRRIKLCVVSNAEEYDRQAAYAAVSRPTLLVFDRLTEDSRRAVFAAAESGLKTVVQLDTAQHGAGVARELLELGIGAEQISLLRWILTTRRVLTLCEKCRHPMLLRPYHLDHLRRRHPEVYACAEREYCAEINAHEVILHKDAQFYQVGTCRACQESGYSGDVSVFDVFHPILQQGGQFDLQEYLACGSALSLEEYLFRLVAQGKVPLENLLWMETDMLRQTYQNLSSSQSALSSANAALTSKLYELESAHRVLLQRTEVLISLEDLGQALIASVSLTELAHRICRRAGELCGAERVILYVARSGGQSSEQMEVLATRGWEGADIEAWVDQRAVLGSGNEKKTSLFLTLPPGVQPRAEIPTGEGPKAAIQNGLRVPLLAQDRQVGAMIVQSTKRSAFKPSDTALLQTFANQAALAIQRAGLVDDLLAKITQLEAAQEELVLKERMERELELARQVQQSLLPSNFPVLSGYTLVAHNEPARQVGGDFYDFIHLDDDHLGLVVADVSDKGMPAALYMALARSLLFAEAHRQPSPRAALETVNNLLSDLGELNGFVSVFYGIVERSTRAFTYVRAGHECPWLLRADGSRQQLKGSGAVLGILETDQLNLSEERIQLQPGDRLMLYSDGMSDVVNEQGNFFGGKLLEELFASLMILSAQEACAQAFQALARYRGSAEQFDDMTLMIFAVD